MRARSAVFFGKKRSAQAWMHAQDVEEIAGYDLPRHLLRLATTAQAERDKLVGCESGENMVLVPVVLIIRKRRGWKINEATLVPLIGGVDIHQASGFLHRQGIQKNRVHHGEDGAVGANPQRQ